ncbi:MAG TPA: tripartite tricarboxylate transporter substrate binding protein [Pseudorhodoferax sp.]|nr:tripartite tricarboxylate transporter substrate binding protein [Pseudorhodoferax sp.]
MFPRLAVAAAACAICAVSTAMLSTAAHAQQPYPNKPITLIVPFGPGGTSDIMARFMQQPLGEVLGVPVVVDNQAGAGGAIGMTALKNAAPDGYTIGLSVIGPQMLQPALRNTGYTADSFEPICGTYDVPLMLMVKPDSKFKQLSDVIGAAKAQPGQLTYGSSGTGTVLHLSMAMLLDQARTDGLHVPYKSSGEMITGLLGQQIALFAETPTISTQYKLRGLAVLAKDRLPAYPDVPTSAEGGLPLQASVWGGFIAPKGLPAAVRQKLEAACDKAAHSAAYQQKAEQVNTPLVYRNSQDYGAFVKAEQARYTQLIKTLGLAEKQ